MGDIVRFFWLYNWAFPASAALNPLNKVTQTNNGRVLTYPSTIKPPFYHIIEF